MRALRWHAPNDVRVDTVPDPTILNPRDAIVRVSSTAICGSDLHLYDGYIPTMKEGDVLGHEFMGEIVELGEGARGALSIGDRVVVPFPIACGSCRHCGHDEFSLCDNSNPNAEIAEAAYGYSGAGIFGYSHMLGGYAGGQAEYVRVPFADVGPMKVPEGLTDEQVLFLSDILPTGYQAALNCDIKQGDTVAVWGAGPVGLFSMLSAKLLGAGRIFAIDEIPERLAKAAEHIGAETLDFSKDDVLAELRERTGGRGPDACIEAVGLEAHGVSAIEHAYDKVKQALRLQTDRAGALRQAIMACGKGGTLSIPGVYGGLIDKMPIGAAFGKGLTFRMGQTHVHAYLHDLMDKIESGEIDPSFIITHRMKLEEAPAAYDMFKKKQDECVKVVLTP